MIELNEIDALGIARNYYIEVQHFKPEDATLVVERLSRVDIAGLLIFTYDRAIKDVKGEIK